jgi:hypothetical protein
MQSLLCQDQPKIQMRLTLDVGEGWPIIWGQKSGSSNSIQTMSVCYKKSRKLAVTFLLMHAIMVLPNATPLCHDWSETCLQLTLDVSEDDPVIRGQRAAAATTFDHVSLLQKIKKSCSNFSLSVCHHVVAQCIPPYAMIGLKFA